MILSRLKFIIPSLLLLFFMSCKEQANEVELTVEGQVVRASTQSPVQGATVQLSQQTLDGGVVSGAFDQIGEIVTGQNGTFSFTFQRKNTVEFLLEVDQPNYFSRDFTINPDDFNPDNPYNLTVNLDSRAWLQVSIQNTAPETFEDEISYSNLNASFPTCACCNNQTVTLTGQTVDTSFTCQLLGDRTIYYSYQISKLSYDSSRIDSVFCPAFDTTQVNISY
ncbi:hypothetical protein [Halocola ammonii]